MGQTQDIRAMIVTLGLVKEDDTQSKTCLFHLWLLSYEFSETIIGFTTEKVVVLTSKRKKEILDSMVCPKDYKGPPLTVLLRDTTNKEA